MLLANHSLLDPRDNGAQKEESAMTHPDRIDEASHDREATEERDEHLGSENPHRVPVKETNDPSHTDLPDTDLDRSSEEAGRRTRRDMH